MRFGVIAFVIDAHDDGVVLVGRRRGDDHLLRSTLVDVDPALGGVGEQSGGLDDDVHAEVFPGQLGGVLVTHEFHRLAIDDDVVSFRHDGRAERAQGGVVFQEVGERMGVPNVVDGDDFEGRLQRVSSPVDVAADAAETIDPNPGHWQPLI